MTSAKIPCNFLGVNRVVGKYAFASTLIAETYECNWVINSLYREMYLSWITLRNSSELIAYCCIPRASMYNSLKRVGLCSPANKFSWEEVTLWISCTVLISFPKFQHYISHTLTLCYLISSICCTVYWPYCSKHLQPSVRYCHIFIGGNWVSLHKPNL